MNRAEACNYLRSSGFSKEQIKAIEGAFTCEDCISRQAVLDVTWEEPSYTDALNVLTEVRDKVKALPPVNPQKPKSECEHDHEILKAYSDGANEVLDKVRAEIEHVKDNPLFGMVSNDTMLDVILEIIDKYKAEGSGEE